MEAVQRPGNELYMRAYMDGYTAGVEKAKGEIVKPYLTVEDVMARYGGISKGKAYEIMVAVRHCCNGGKLNHNGMILLSELEYWESVVDAKFKERL
ncbi:MAG: hypothetical protein IJX39_04580 [Clostridia bacterium]|nr:hypothetical protein [Clostridia bacterium]MBQ8357065.1 hypothetical protein [Clostridia bacterium]